jgi:isopentenyl-diphosphate delta-isomerase
VDNNVILVDAADEVLGVEDKIKTHMVGALHRAFSVFIFDADDRLLLQKRASTKYHSRGLWSNTCCGHPRLGESIEYASRRRLNEEMGFDCAVQEILKFIYHAKLDNGLFEHEYDHVLVGRFDGNPIPNRDEVDDWKWIELTALEREMQKSPNTFTSWFGLALSELYLWLRSSSADSFTLSRTTEQVNRIAKGKEAKS